MKKLAIFSTTLLFTASCATVSYSPPYISIDQSKDQSKNLPAAIALVDTFIKEYRKRANGAGNGRQIFDIPAIGAAIGAVAATAFGAGANVTIAAGAVGALTGAGKAYYAPNMKAEIYSDGLNALICIQQVSLDLQPFSEAARETAKLNLDDELENVRRFTAIKNAVLIVEANVRTRLNKSGSTPDVSSLTSELQEIIEKRKAAEEAAAAEAGNIRTGGVALSEIDRRNLTNSFALVPKLEACAIRSKA